MSYGYCLGSFGYVHSPQQQGGVQAVYFGFAPSPTPSADQIVALAALALVSSPGSYVLNQPPNAFGYPCLAFPAGMAVNTPFTIDNFNYQFPQSQVTIGGVNYQVFTLADPTYADSLTVGVS